MKKENNKKIYLSASLICADLMDLEEEIKRLEEAKIDYIHFDVMDGVFVPRYGLYPEMLQAMKDVSSIPVDVHMMVVNPEPYIETLKKAGADIMIVHIEGNNNLHRTLKLIKDSGMKAGVALNLATPLNVLDYILEDIDWVMLMAINPGIVGHKLVPKVMDKISELRKKISGHPHIKIEIDGGVSFESAPEMIKAGADILVCGSSTIFKKEQRVDDKVRELRESIERSLKK